MNPGAARRVVHVVPPNGGGVDRFVRDLCRHRTADWIVHAGQAQCVVEWPAREVFIPLPTVAMTDLAFGGVLGRPQAVHAHSTAGMVRQLSDTVRAATRSPCVLTLHDIGFADPAATAFERAQRRRFARAAAARTAPSRYIVELAGQALGADAPCLWVENGVDPWPMQGGTPAAPTAPGDQAPGICAVAVIGAIGEHKGLSTLLEVAAGLPAGMRVVIIGYTAQQLMPGWAVPGRVWLHGAFEPAELPALVAHYGVKLAFFPPGMPESYCYALSDAWLAGLPVLVPDQGALTERVRRHGGGHLYPPQLPPSALAAWIAKRAASASPAGAVPANHAMATVQQMVTAMNAIYQDAGGDAADTPADEAALRLLAQPHLDGQFFRKELLHLQGRLEAMTQAHDRQGERVAQLEAQGALADERHRREAGEWRQALDTLKAQNEAARAAHDALAQAHAALRAQQDALQSEHQALQARHQVLQQRHGALTAWLARPLRLLPASLRERAMRLGRRWLD